MSSPYFSPAAELLKALGINEPRVLAYSIHFSAQEVTTCMVEVVISKDPLACHDPLQSFEEQLKRYKVTLEPLEDETLGLPDGLAPAAEDLSVPPASPSWEQFVP